MPYALSHHYETCGINLTTPFPLNYTLEGNGTAEVEVRFEAVPEMLPSPSVRGVRFEAGPGQLLLLVDQVARFLVEDGSQVFIDPIVGYDLSEIQHFLTTSILGALLHQRRILSLRGAAVEQNGHAILLLGAPGAGKSTLAAALCQRGWNLLSDELVALDTSTNEVWVMPEGPHQHLWPSTIKALNLDQPSQAVRPQLQKRLIHHPHAFQADDCAVKRIYILAAGHHETPTLLPLKGADRFRALRDHTYRGAYLDGLGESGSHLLNTSTLMKSVKHTALVSFKHDYEKLENLVECLMGDQP